MGKWPAEDGLFVGNIGSIQRIPRAYKAQLPHYRAYGSVPRRFGGLSTHQLFHRKQTRRRKRALVKARCSASEELNRQGPLIGAETARPTDRPDVLDYLLPGRVALNSGGRGNTEKALVLLEHAFAPDPPSREARRRLATALCQRATPPGP